MSTTLNPTEYAALKAIARYDDPPEGTPADTLTSLRARGLIEYSDNLRSDTITPAGSDALRRMQVEVRDYDPSDPRRIVVCVFVDNAFGYRFNAATIVHSSRIGDFGTLAMTSVNWTAQGSVEPDTAQQFADAMQYAATTSRIIQQDMEGREDAESTIDYLRAVLPPHLRP